MSAKFEQTGEGRKNVQAWPKFWAVGDTGDILLNPHAENTSSEAKLSRPFR